MCLVNFATEPLRAADVAHSVFKEIDFRTVTTGPPVRYDMHTRHAKIFGGTGRYMRHAATVLAALREFVVWHRGGMDREAGHLEHRLDTRPRQCRRRAARGLRSGPLRWHRQWSGPHHSRRQSSRWRTTGGVGSIAESGSVLFRRYCSGGPNSASSAMSTRGKPASTTSAA